MKPKNPSHQKQGHLLYPDLLGQLDPKDLLLALARRLPWEQFEKEFAPLYSEMGRPAKPVRLMVGLLSYVTTCQVPTPNLIFWRRPGNGREWAAKSSSEAVTWSASAMS